MRSTCSTCRYYEQSVSGGGYCTLTAVQESPGSYCDDYEPGTQGNEDETIGYVIKVRATMNDGTEHEQIFGWWCDAADYVALLAEGDEMPSVVTMTMESIKNH